MDSTSTRFVRWGGVCGLLMIAVVFTFAVVGPALLGVGEPPGSFATEGQVREYFGHPALAWMQAPGPAFAVLGLIFVAAVRDRTRATGGPWGDLALHAFAILVAGLMVEMGITVALVREAASGGDVMLLFRPYDAFYNYFLEIVQGVVVLFLSLAALGSYPRWLAWSGIALAAFHPIMAVRAFVPQPGILHSVGMLWFVAWFVALAILTLRSPRPRAERAPADATTPGTS